jgi:molybdopterin/thiamine biosynthesis adenylyltransferase
MHGEDGRVADGAEVREAIAGADVLIVGFPGFLERLLVDSRSSGEAGPMVRVVEPLGGVEERMFWLGRNRPQFGMPQRFTFFVWPHSVAFMEDTGVVEAVRDSVAVADGPEQLATAIEELKVLERTADRAAVDGRPWRTLWHATAPKR